MPFLDSLAQHPRVRKGTLRVGLVGNKLKPWTNASQQAVELLRAWPYPVVAQLRGESPEAIAAATTANARRLFVRRPAAA